MVVAVRKGSGACLQLFLQRASASFFIGPESLDLSYIQIVRFFHFKN